MNCSQRQMPCRLPGRAGSQDNARGGQGECNLHTYIIKVYRPPEMFPNIAMFDHLRYWRHRLRGQGRGDAGPPAPVCCARRTRPATHKRCHVTVEELHEAMALSPDMSLAAPLNASAGEIHRLALSKHLHTRCDPPSSGCISVPLDGTFPLRAGCCGE